MKEHLKNLREESQETNDFEIHESARPELYIQPRPETKLKTLGEQVARKYANDPIVGELYLEILQQSSIRMMATEGYYIDSEAFGILTGTLKYSLLGDIMEVVFNIISYLKFFNII